VQRTDGEPRVRFYADLGDWKGIEMTIGSNAHSRNGKHRVVVAGGGFAALEAVLGIRQLAGERVEVDLVSAERELTYRPLAVVEPFGLGEAPRFDLAKIAATQHVKLSIDAVRAVDTERRVVQTGSGTELSYDSLVIAIGARPQRAVPGAFTYRGTPDAPELRWHLERVEAGEVPRTVFAVPAGIAWPLPLYEIALMTAARLTERNVNAELELVTAEQAPLAIFGSTASEAVAKLLDERGVKVRTSCMPTAFENGVLALVPSSPIPAELVIALPRLVGNPVPGLPADADGFFPVDRNCGIVGVDGVYAAGDATSFPIKQGGIATQQADVVAREVAARAGAAVSREPFRPVLRGMLLTGEGARFMRAEPAGGGDPSQFSSQMLWWPGTKVAGQYVSHYLAREVEQLGPTPAVAPEGIPVDVDLGEVGAHD
jgi:sulfide:quinone oxidoreductase